MKTDAMLGVEAVALAGQELADDQQTQRSAGGDQVADQESVVEDLAKRLRRAVRLRLDEIPPTRPNDQRIRPTAINTLKEFFPRAITRWRRIRRGLPKRNIRVKLKRRIRPSGNPHSQNRCIIGR